MHAPRPLDYTPARVLAGGGNPIAGFESATATLRALYKPGSAKAEAAGYDIVSSFHDVLAAAVEESAPVSLAPRKQMQEARDPAWWRRWLAGVRDLTLAICDAYWVLPRAGEFNGAEALRLRMAGSVVEAIRWAACDRFSPDEALWKRLAVLFAESPDAGNSVIGGDVPGVGREYLRAVAYFSANLEQLELDAAVALMAIIDRLLPFLELARRKTVALQYEIVPLAQPMPVRCAGAEKAGAWYFSAAAADELLASFQVELERGAVPVALGALDLPVALEAVRNLRAFWGAEPPVRHRRRYPQQALVDVARGLEDCMSVIGGGETTLPRRWQVQDFSQSGLHIWAGRDPARAWPDIGELLGVHFVDGKGWQLCVVRRLRMWPSSADLGVELIARAPTLATIDDGRAQVVCILCDEIRKGEVLRAVLPANTEFLSDRAFLREGGSLYTLSLAAAQISEKSYRILAFQVL